MRGSLFPVVLFPVCIFAAMAALPAEPTVFPVGPGGRLFGNPDVDALVVRPYAEHVPMACTGERLWATHPEGWGFPADTVNYYLVTGIGLGYDVSVQAGPQEIIAAHGASYPSRVELLGGGRGIEVKGTKWITADDVMGCRLDLENQSPGDEEITVSISVPSNSANVDGDRVSWTTESAGRTIQSIGRFPDFAAVPGPPIAEKVFAIEGEKADAQLGSTGEDDKAAASGGQVLGKGFGTRPGHSANYHFNFSEEQKNMALTVRYARGMPGDADFLVQFPGRKRFPRVLFHSTGGWGDSPSDFATVTCSLGDIPEGSFQLLLLSISANNNVNIDALYIHPQGTIVEGVDAPASGMERKLTVKAGESTTVDLFVAVNTDADQADAALQNAMDSPDALQDQIGTYNNWLVENVPAFSGPETITKIYWHRATDILKKNLFRVGDGRLKDWGIAEGRWTSSWFANMISYGAGHQIREARWLRDPQYVRGIINTWCANERPDGIFPNYIRPGEIGTGQYTDWITSTVWDAYCVQPDRAALERWADALKKNVDGWLAVYDPDDDGLLMVDSHWWTGMEWQPSFFYFNGFDKDKQDQHLERVDLTAYVYGDARNLARVLSTLGDDAGAEHYNGIADKIRDATCGTLWDDAHRFFYSVEPDAHKKAMVKEVVGVYPFYFSMFDGIDGSQYTSAWRSILDPEQFWTPWPVASASKQCPAYSQDESFNEKNVGGCMWNGPTWPHANSMVLSAMAETLREYPSSPLRVADMYGLFRSYTEAQFYKHDIQFPWTGEFYNGETGEWRTEQRDYNHSTYIDILIADIAGLRPRADDMLELHPLVDPSMGPFVVDGIRYHDHDVTIAWAPATDPLKTPDGIRGFRVYVDGELRHHDPLCAFPVEIPLQQ